MRKYDIDDATIKQIILHRQKGRSWIYIERVTGVPRRAAQHRFKEFERNRIAIEVSEARKEFTKQEFGGHVDTLTDLAAAFLFGIVLPESPIIMLSADEALDRILDTEILPTSSICATDPNERQIAARRRRNGRLFAALKEHTEQEIPWQRLEEWKVGWDACRELLARFEQEINGVLAGVLDEEPEVKANIDKGARGVSGVKVIAKAVLRCPWRMMLRGDKKWAEAFTVREGVGEKEDLFELRYIDEHVALFINRDIAGSALEICRRVMEKARTLRVVKNLEAEVAKVQSVVEEFEDRFDAVELRPVILRTRCRICPA